MLPEHYQAILSRLERVKRAVGRTGSEEWNACCPAHEDHNPSLVITYERHSEKLLLHCRAGCTFEAIVAALRVDKRDLFPKNTEGTFSRENVAGVRIMQNKIVATYPYHDEKGQLLFEVVRYEPKSFSCRRPDGRGGWIANLEGITKPLYNLPELLAKPDQPVCIVEGEKDVETLRKLGLVGTTNQGGAGKWEAGYSKALRGRRVAILPDNDEPGHRHAQLVAGSLLYWGAASVRIVHLPGLPEKCDVTDWVTDLVTPGVQSQLRLSLCEFIKAAPEYSRIDGTITKVA